MEITLLCRSCSYSILLSLIFVTTTFRTTTTSSKNDETFPSSPDRIAILHMVNRVHFFQDLATVTLRNKRRYATLHNYEMIVHTPAETSGLLKMVDCDDSNDDDRREEIVRTDIDGNGVKRCYRRLLHGEFQLDKGRAPTFGKLKLASQACVGRDDYWLLWTDADAMVVNQSRSLLDVVDDAYDIMVASDWFMINAGVLLLRCSEWGVKFLENVYNNRAYDKALALDQSQLNDAFKKRSVRKHVKNVPKWLINVYTEEYVPGDFIVHFAGKLYEATPKGITAIAKQFDVLSRAEEREQIEAFFNTRYFLNYFSGTCVMGPPNVDTNRECLPSDPRRMKLPEPLGAFSHPNRYRQLKYRNPRLAGWRDKYDFPGAADIRIRRGPGPR